MPARAKSANPASESEAALQVSRDHEAIARLADDLLPALIAKLAASGLGEIEVRQGGWKARLRMPATVDESRKSAGKAVEGHAGHGPSGRGSAVHSRPEERDRHSNSDEQAADEHSRIAAKSPAVGVYNPRSDLAVGMRVRSGERIGQVNVLGVNQDVVSPVDGVIGSSLAESGEAVEYGQELVRIELPQRAAGGDTGRPEREPAGVAGKA
jgi:biotin carboxyl carrier protein